MSKNGTGNKRLKITGIILAIIIFICICVADTVNQKRISVMRAGYTAMEDGDYKAATIYFKDYIAGHSKIYWILVDYFNKTDYDGTYANVSEAFSICKKEEKIQ